MDDLIFRQDAIDLVEKWFLKIGLNGDICLDGLRSLSSAQQWIPCSEKLPEVGHTAYLATLDYGDFGVETGQRFFYNQGIGWDDDAVVAWMPLPEPWKEVKDEYIN